MTRLILTLITFSILTASAVSPAVAQEDCKPIYGGGVTEDKVCDGKIVTTPTDANVKKATPTPIKDKKTTPTPIKPKTTTKGGLPIVSPVPQQTTPSTGPEVVGLIALAPAAALGLYLRKRYE